MEFTVTIKPDGTRVFSNTLFGKTYKMTLKPNAIDFSQVAANMDEISEKIRRFIERKEVISVKKTKKVKKGGKC